MLFLSQMFLQMITKLTSPKSILPFSKILIRPAKTLVVLPSQFSSAALPLSRQLHSCCLLRHGAHERPILAAVTRFLEQSPKLQPFLNAESPSSNLIQKRSVTKWSLSKGKRKTVKTVIRRFKRLDWLPDSGNDLVIIQMTHTGLSCKGRVFLIQVHIQESTSENVRLEKCHSY
ncbi:uncharacterized protein LOC135196223 isoform X2 [Macrobrachium nipponense]|uniref:uncharacterized protein LOC135196223 isoform X2 n=1 Tax=Macrobrachium nipponense TaxID=159736 RepID=UPI0030C7DD9C